jgi:hypothetical protein
MKVEYQYYAGTPSMVIKGADFIKAFDNRDDEYLLHIAVGSFCERYGTVSHSNESVNDEIKQNLEKTGNVIYAVKEIRKGRTFISEWVEVYVLNGTKLIEIVVSHDDGRTLSIIAD